MSNQSQKLSEILTEKEERVWSYYNNGFKISDICEILSLSKEAVRSRIRRATEKIKNTDSSFTSQKKEEFVEQKTDIFWKKKYNALLKERSFEDEFLKIFKDRLDFTKFNQYKLKNTISVEEPETYILMLADFHFGENVAHDQIYGLNTCTNYEKTIYNRLQLLYTKILNLIYEKPKKKLDIFILGDMVCGTIHDELVSEISVVDQVLFLTDILFDFIVKLKKKFEFIDISCVFGNHGRMSRKPSYKNRHNNFDYILYKMLELKLSNVENINIDVPRDSFIIKNIGSKNFFVTHGDLIKSSGLNSIEDFDKKFSQIIMNKYNKMIHYFCFGHFHTANIFDKIGGKIISAGSLKGTDEYSLYKCNAFSEPSQTFIELSKTGINWISDIKLNETL